MINFLRNSWDIIIFIELLVFIGLLLLAAIIIVLLKLLVRRKSDNVGNTVSWNIPLFALQKIVTVSPFFLKETPFRIPIETRKETPTFAYYMYKYTAVAALKHTKKPQDDLHSRNILRTMTSLRSSNLNHFLGLTIQDPSTCMSVWKYCCRGSVFDVIRQNNVKFDEFIKISFIHDMVNGLNFLHHSTLKCHGLLNSKCCLVSDRWRIQISQYGLSNLDISSINPTDPYESLYLAPEILNHSAKTAPEADLYSLAIICSEIINVADPWNLSSIDKTFQEVLNDVKTGKSEGPSLKEKSSALMDRRIIPLMKRCWSFNPVARPVIGELKDVCESLCPGRNGSLIDHMVEGMKNEATFLRKQLKKRTDDFVKERNNSDMLLYRMLPKTVAECLKAGKGVVPEAYESVSILFSDIVSFTTISSSCSPWQIVQLLNDLYTKMDSVVKGFDVYKVETIGDCYMLVSGVPERNGTEHIKNICVSAIKLLDATANIGLPHDESKFLELRVGIHSGPVVAGVVGLIMPRFCLFGDTVNTASRMESTGEASKIHLSPNANQLLKSTYPEFTTECRGDIHVKGKGNMMTYWLKR